MSSMTPAQLLTAWEDAYLAQCQAARIGRYFKGTVHNLNGVVQAFSMQSELFALMFAKADRLLGEALDSVENDDARDKITQTLELLQKRRKTLGQVDEKVLLSQEILKNTVDFSQVSGEASSLTLNMLIDNMIVFFHSHMFFKHKVQKDIVVDAAIHVGEQAFAISVILCNLIENSILALEENHGQEARFALRCFVRDENIIIEVKDNGVGVPEHIQETLFNEFVSATPGHQGLGLYQAQKMVDAMGGEISNTCLANPTIFTVTLPLHIGKA